MARGGRRRRKRGSGRGPRPEGAQQQTAAAPQGEGAKRRRRRRGRGGGLTEKSVIEAMSSRPKTLITLPPDGQVLEEMIEDLQREYGTPTTPQEYRLLIKIPVPPGATESQSAQEGQIRLDPVDEEETPDGEPRRKRRRRRRGRRRKTGPDGQPLEGAEPSFEDDEPDDAGTDEVDDLLNSPIEVSDPSTSGVLRAEQAEEHADIEVDRGPEAGA